MNCRTRRLEDRGVDYAESDLIKRRKEELVLRILLLPHGKKKNQHLEELMNLEVRLWKLNKGEKHLQI